VATVTLREKADPDLWLPRDEPATGLYLGHLAVDRAFAGLGAGVLVQAARGGVTAR
jgi:hypothetical protein